MSLPDTVPAIQIYCGRSCKTRSYTLAHLEEKREYAARWRQENRDRIQAYAAEYRAQHRETLRAINGAMYRSDSTPWRNGRDRRRQVERGVRLRFTDRDWRRAVERVGGRCYYCGRRRKLSRDHVIPLSRGGRHSVGNVIPACMECNLAKGRRFIMEWRLGRMVKSGSVG